MKHSFGHAATGWGLLSILSEFGHHVILRLRADELCDEQHQAGGLGEAGKRYRMSFRAIYHS